MVSKNRIILFFMILAMFMCIALACFCFLGPKTINAVASALDLNNIQNISITLKYQGAKFVYNSCEHLPSCSTYLQERILLKNNRLGSHAGRAGVIEQMITHNIPIKDAFCYMFFDWNNYFDSIIARINKKPVDAKLEFLPNKKCCFDVTKEEYGYYLSETKVMEEILKQLHSTDCIVVDLKPKTLLPNVYYSELIKQTSLLSKFSTNYSTSGVDRKNNINLAISKFNGLKILPNQTISFNSITGVRNKEKGYREAHMILNGEYIDAVGGGVCQVSTTLYNALLLAGVRIDEVHSHSLPSSYVELGFDAMVNYGTSDLVFTNTNETPIYLKTYTTSEKVCVEVYGQECLPNVKIKRVCDVISQTPPPVDRVIVDDAGEFLNEVEFSDEWFYKTKPKDGFKVNAYLEYISNGKVLRRKLIRTVTYSPQRGIKVFGAKTRPQNNFDQEFLKTIGNILAN